jgi:predicted amidohydrolase
MLAAAAGGETKSEIDAALSFTNDTGPSFHEARNAVARALETRNHVMAAGQNGQTLLC